MTLDELLAWKKAHQEPLTAFLHQHREISGIHFMPGDGPNAAGAYIEFSLKTEIAAPALEAEIATALGDVPHRVTVLVPGEDATEG
jgi:hypothetical protein